MLHPVAILIERVQPINLRVQQTSTPSRRHRRPRAWARGTCSLSQCPPPWKSYKVFLCISNDSKRSVIIYTLFFKPFVGFWRFALRPSVPGPRCLLTCPLLEENPAGADVAVFRFKYNQNRTVKVSNNVSTKHIVYVSPF